MMAEIADSGAARPKGRLDGLYVYCHSAAMSDDNLALGRWLHTCPPTFKQALTQ
jgi:hypothetical protein